jgi:hypothetical protein
MANYRDLMKCIQRGLSVTDILDELNIQLNHLERMLQTQALERALTLEEHLIARVVRHRLAMDVAVMANRLREMALDGSGETSRKACLSLLAEGLKTKPGRHESPAEASTPSRTKTPAALNAPLKGKQGRPQHRKRRGR